jgi:predicted DNA-binding ribbon-helix-helix protein
MARPKDERARGQTVPRRNVFVAGHKTSVSLEDPFWKALREIAVTKGVRVSELVSMIDETRRTNLASAIRLFVLDHYRRAPLG